MDAYDPFSEPPAESASSAGFDVAPKRKRPRPFFNEEYREEPPEEKPRREEAPADPMEWVKRTGKDVATLIGKVKEVRDPTMKRICNHYLAGDCLWGDQCRFSHNPDDLKNDAPPTEAMNFNNMEVGQVTRSVPVARPVLKYLMFESTQRLLKEASGVSEVSWVPEKSEVAVSGNVSQTEAAEQLLKRVTTHCKWGVSETKVAGLLSMRPRQAARITLSPMMPSLKQAAFHMTVSNTQAKIGSDPSNDLTLKGPLISRSHALLEFMPSKGALYVVDKSTNGTFLNGVRLPERSLERAVAVFHGDELLFPEPGRVDGNTEFGYMVNVELMG